MPNSEILLENIEENTFLRSINPATQKVSSNSYQISTAAEIDSAALNAHESWKIYKNISGKDKAVFLRTIANEIEALGDTLVNIAMAESGFPENRIKGERGRTCNQLRQFADLVEEGSWVNAIIDEALPDRQPLPRADIRKVSLSIGPVAVFTASNFPLAFSTAGGDTASALAAGCPVIVKAHPSHLETNALVSTAITTAVNKCNLPKGVFASVQGGIETGQYLIQNPTIKAVGFTGSFKGGRALFDLASRRVQPIPVYAEMGSNNPIFILQEKLESEYADLAKTIANSVNMGAGQFCTNPGILVLQKNDSGDAFLEALKSEFSKHASATMLNEGIYNAYNTGKEACIKAEGVTVLFERKEGNEEWKGEPAIAAILASNFLQDKTLQEEVFGPFTLAVLCENKKQMMDVANSLNGQLTASVMATEEELTAYSDLVDLMTQKAGRVIFNNVPTGVEVCQAMHHGGPYPSTSNSMFTSVGMDAIQRFVCPVSFQNIPDALLPESLRRENPLNIWRTINGEKTKC